MDFFLWVTASSNVYACKKENKYIFCFAGHPWTNITLEEMIHFFLIVLKMIICDQKIGGYETYFENGILI